jgi:phosphatidylglycerophosphatase A
MEQLAKFLITFGFLGYSRYIPGTMGTLGAAAGYGLLWHWQWVNIASLALLLAVVSLLTWLLGNWAERYWQKKDPQCVVLDEVAGFLVSVFLFQPSWWVIAGGFLSFRLFDGWKPYPIRKMEALPGGLGILCDDLLAGVYALMLLLLLSWLAHVNGWPMQLQPALWQW